MKKIISIIIILSFISFCYGCGDTKVIEEIEYDTYGLFNSKDKKNPNIQYELIKGNVIWSVILFETIIAPIYFLGFSIYEPVGILDPTKIKGAI